MLVFAASGCSSETSHGTVHGMVKLDGEPLANGLIRFLPADGRSPTAEATITDGNFNAPVPVGEKRVSISAARVVGTRKAYETLDSPTIDVVEELLPARYNVRSELTLTVKPGRQQQDFELNSGGQSL
jgi:hypothetical protein